MTVGYVVDAANRRPAGRAARVSTSFPLCLGIRFSALRGSRRPRLMEEL